MKPLFHNKFIICTSCKLFIEIESRLSNSQSNFFFFFISSFPKNARHSWNLVMCPSLFSLFSWYMPQEWTAMSFLCTVLIFMTVLTNKIRNDNQEESTFEMIYLLCSHTYYTAVLANCNTCNTILKMRLIWLMPLIDFEPVEFFPKKIKLLKPCYPLFCKESAYDGDMAASWMDSLLNLKNFLQILLWDKSRFW